MLSDNDSIPAFSILFLPIEKTLKFGVPCRPLAISATPNGPSPQLLIKNTYRDLAVFKKLSKAFAP